MRSLRPGPAIMATLFVAAVVVWGLVMFNTGVIFRLTSGGTYRVTAIFDEVPGLTKGSEVRAGGVKVGEVRDISLEGDRLLPHVTLEIDDDFRLRQGAIADLRLYSNVGELNRYIALQQGTGPELHDGATLGLALTDQPVEIDQVLRVLDKKTRADVSGVLDSLSRVTQGQEGYFRLAAATGGEALGNTAEVLSQINSDGQALRTLVHDGNSVVAAMAQDPASLGGFADQLAGLLRTTADRETELANTSGRAAPAFRQTRLALDRVRSAIPNLRRLVSVARPAVAQLPPTAQQLRPVLKAARPTLQEAHGLINDAPANLQALIPALQSAAPELAPLTHATCQTGPTLDTLRAAWPDVLGGVTLYGALAANYDANGHAARVILHLPRVTGGTVNEDQNHAGFVVKPFLRAPGANIDQPWTNWRSSFIGGDGDCG